jgi:hypothetical protein
MAATFAALSPVLCLTRDTDCIDASAHSPRITELSAHAASPHDASSTGCLLAEQCHEHRIGVESFIRERFAATYGAQISAFMPQLFSMRNAQGATLGAFGLRDASQPLFLERYLDQPVEREIADALGMPVERSHIVEVGQFAGTGAGTTRAMIMQLTALLHRQGFKWVVFTGTVALRNAFFRLGLNPTDMAAAAPERLGKAERDLWGSYYEHLPRVLFGNIAEGFSALTCNAARGGQP